MKSDVEIQQDVIDELKWEPILDASEIGVTVKGGVVTLSGTVSTYSKKMAAERAARRVQGVTALAEDIEVVFFAGTMHTDTEIAQAAVQAIKSQASLADQHIQIKVEEGVVKLEGQVEWEYQRNEAKKAMENLKGVRSVINLINIKPRATAKDVEQQIAAAFQRHANIDARNIQIEIDKDRAILRGTVRSLAEMGDAVDAAWAAPGISKVENELTVKLADYPRYDD